MNNDTPLLSNIIATEAETLRCQIINLIEEFERVTDTKVKNLYCSDVSTGTQRLKFDTCINPVAQAQTATA